MAHSPGLVTIHSIAEKVASFETTLALGSGPYFWGAPYFGRWPFLRGVFFFGGWPLCWGRPFFGSGPSYGVVLIVGDSGVALNKGWLLFWRAPPLLGGRPLFAGGAVLPLNWGRSLFSGVALIKEWLLFWWVVPISSGSPYLGKSVLSLLTGWSFFWGCPLIWGGAPYFEGEPFFGGLNNFPSYRAVLILGGPLIWGWALFRALIWGSQ